MPESKDLSKFEFRIIVMMPTGRDEKLVCQSLADAGLWAKPCSALDDLKKSLNEGAGAILIAEEALQQGKFDFLVEFLQRQEIWSDVPVILLAADRRSSENLLNTVGTLINITILERPLPKAILLSAMRSALRARKKQYQTRNLLAALKEADNQKDLFLATLSHELRTPLNSMLGWIQLLKKQTGDNFDRVHALNVIERNAKAQTQIINDILLISRIVTGKLEIAVKNIDFREVLEAVIDVTEPSVKEKNIRLEVLPNEDSAMIKGDSDRLQQVFWNLLSNAVKFTPENGLIKIETRREETSLAVEISDNGEGIDAEFIPFIFERFRQADSSYTRSVGGLGLGLSIVHSIVEQHGGSIAVASAGAGKGTAFTVRLPLAAADFQPPAPEFAAPPKTGENLDSLRILLAEDDDDSREMLVFLLRQNCLEIEAVASASAALAAIDRNPPQLLISDVGMPGMDGYQLINKIRALPPEKGGTIPAIALTGYAGSQDQARSIDSGYQAHLTKPVDFEALFKTIRKLIEEPPV